MMSAGKGMFAAIAVSAAYLLVLPGAAEAQEKNCTGHEPEGGKWSTSAELYLQRARQAGDPQNKQQRYQDAVRVLREGFEEQPNNPRNYAMAGQAYAGLNEYESADSMFTKAANLYSCWEAHVDSLRFRAWVQAFNTAVNYARSEDAEKAVDWYRNAWTVYDRMPQPMIQLGGHYAQKALAADSMAVREEAQRKAIESYEKALAALTNPPPQVSEDQSSELARAATFNLAQLLALEGRYEEAAQAYQEFLEQEPGNLAALENLAVVATRAATEAEREAADLEEGAERETLVAKADSLRTMAAGYFTDLLEREDLAPGDYFNLGVGLAQLDEHEDAVEAFNVTLDYEPYSHDAMQQLALVLFEAQDYDSLAAVASKLVERYPLDLNYTALLANAYRELDQREDALSILERRDSIQVEVSQLEFERGEGEYTISGQLENLKAAPGTEVVLTFDFYDDAGEVVGSEMVTITAPEQNQSTEFTVTTQSDLLISGFTYHRGESEQQASDGQ